MNYHARPLRKHRRQQRTIEPYGGHQVEVDLLPPLLVVECGEPTGRRLRAAKHIDDDVDAAEVIERALRDNGAAHGRRDGRRDIVHMVGRVARNRTRRRHHVRAVLAQDVDDGGADPSRSGRNERAATTTEPQRTELEDA